jgi:hypothetical protein
MSRYRTLRKLPYHQRHHRSQPAKEGRCTVTGVRPWHPAEFSIWVRSDREECRLAACAQHVPPMAKD